MPTSTVKLKSGGKMLVQWSEGDILKLPINVLKILNVFVEKDKSVLSTEEIRQALNNKLNGKRLGGVLAAFSKYKTREPLLGFLLKISQNNSLYEIKPGHLPTIKMALLRVRKYLEKY